MGLTNVLRFLGQLAFRRTFMPLKKLFHGSLLLMEGISLDCSSPVSLLCIFIDRQILLNPSHYKTVSKPSLFSVREGDGGGKGRRWLLNLGCLNKDIDISGSVHLCSRELPPFVVQLSCMLLTIVSFYHHLTHYEIESQKKRVLPISFQTSFQNQIDH